MGKKRHEFHLGSGQSESPGDWPRRAGERERERTVRSLGHFSQRSGVSDLKETQERKASAQAGRPGGREGVEREDKDRRGCQSEREEVGVIDWKSQGKQEGEKEGPALTAWVQA